MNGHRYLKFWPQDWQRDPAVRSCGVAARGLWIELLCIMHGAEPYGHLVINGRAATNKQVGMIVGVSEREAAKLIRELEDAGVFSRTDDGTIYSRRMVRDEIRSEEGRAQGVEGGNPDIIRGTVPKDERVRRFRPSDAPAKAKRIWDKSGGRCHWCGVHLTMEAGPARFHVDHVAAVRDGGTNDESNLVAACADCNHKRARHSGKDTVGSGPTGTGGVGVGNAPTPIRPLSLYSESESEEEEKNIYTPGTAPKPRASGDPSRQLALVEPPRSEAAQFEVFWQHYPRKEGKGDARKAFGKAIAKAPLPKLLEAIRVQSAVGCLKTRQYSPHPASWLNAERWADVVDVVDPVARRMGFTEADQKDFEPLKSWDEIKGTIQ